MSDSPTIRSHAAFIWSVADLLRGDYKQSEYGKVILPLVVLRRLDCVLEATKPAVLKRHTELAGRIENIEPVLQAAAGEQFFNISPLDFRRLLDDPANIGDNLRAYIAGFSVGARDVIEKFDLAAQIAKLDRANLLFLVISMFADIDLHPDAVSNLEMGYLYEELIRRFSELSNETAGEHFTPREVVRLMVNLLFIEDEHVLATPGTVRTLLDPACGTGGMLSVAEDHLRQLNPAARLEMFGQELNAETYAICRSDMMLKGQDVELIVQCSRVTSGSAKLQLTAFLPPPLRSQLEIVRRRWDPEMAERIGPHFTVCHVVPGGDDWENRVDSLHASGPLRVRIGGVRNWGAPTGGIYLNVDDFDETVSLARRRLSVEEAPGVEYLPHVTLTHPRTTSPDMAVAAWDELDGWTLNEFVSIDAVDVIEYDGLAWRTIRQVSLR